MREDTPGGMAGDAYSIPAMGRGEGLGLSIYHGSVRAWACRASNRMPREPRCASGRMDARKGDDGVPGSGTVRRPDAADAGPRRNPKGRDVFCCMPVSRRLGASDPLCAITHAPWPAAKSTPSRPRVILSEALYVLSAFAAGRGGAQCRPLCCPPLRGAVCSL